MSAAIRVLILTENLAQASSYRSYLASQNGAFEVLLARTAEDALTSCSTYSPECVILDEDFDGSGLCFLDYLAATSGILIFPVVMTTERCDWSVAEACALGVQECITRESANSPGLLAAINRAVRKHRAAVGKSPRALQLLRLNEERSQAVSHIVPCMLWTARPDGVIDFCDSRIGSYSGSALEPHPNEGWIGALHVDDQERGKQDWLESLKTERPLRKQYQLKRSDGVYRCFEVRAVLLRDEHARPAQWLGTCTDIDDAVSLNSQLASLDSQVAHFENESHGLSDGVSLNQFVSSRVTLK